MSASDLLDKTKRYCFATDMDDRPIFAKAREYCPVFPGMRTWLHVGALFCENHVWIALDCQGWKGGVIRFPMEEGIAEHLGNIDVWAFEYPYWNLQQLHSWIGTPCNPKKLFRYGRLTKHPVARLDDKDGTTCSEFLALCDGGHISSVVNKSPYDVVPSDYQRFAMWGRLELIQLMKKE